jgi:thiamine pyrophosphate-dependent acetolactate synthase large subunit-like protein
VQKTPVASPEDVHKAIKEAMAQDRPYVAVLIQTRNGAQWVPISVSAKKS